MPTLLGEAASSGSATATQAVAEVRQNIQKLPKRLQHKIRARLETTREAIQQCAKGRQGCTLAAKHKLGEAPEGRRGSPANSVGGLNQRSAVGDVKQRAAKNTKSLIGEGRGVCRRRYWHCVRCSYDSAVRRRYYHMKRGCTSNRRRRYRTLPLYRRHGG